MLRYKTKSRPGLVALYDIRPGNGAGPFLQPRSPHGATSYWCSIVTMALFHVVSEIFNIEKCWELKGHSKWYRSIDWLWFPIILLQQFYPWYIVFVIFDLTLKPGLQSFKVIGIDTDRSAACDFLLTFYSNRGPISYRFPDIWCFQLKISTFFHPVYFVPQLKEFHLELKN